MKKEERENKRKEKEVEDRRMLWVSRRTRRAKKQHCPTDENSLRRMQSFVGGFQHKIAI
jgi:hypothetical protein